MTSSVAVISNAVQSEDKMAEGHGVALAEYEKPPLMATFRDESGKLVTRRTEIRCGLSADKILDKSWIEHVPGKRGAIMHIETRDGEKLSIDLDHLQCGDILNGLALSQRQAWEDDKIPEDLLEGERTAPPRWIGKVPQSNNVVQLRRGRAA